MFNSKEVGLGFLLLDGRENPEVFLATICLM